MQLKFLSREQVLATVFAPRHKWTEPTEKIAKPPEKPAEAAAPAYVPDIPKADKREAYKRERESHRYRDELARAVAALKASSTKTEDRSMSAEEEFWDRVEEKVADGMPKAKAVAAVVREDPALHAEFIAEVNRGRR